jgi:hypothetical protein
MSNFKRFLAAYTESLLWLAERDGDYPSESEELEIRADAWGFWCSNYRRIMRNPELAGHDFALTRNRHGAGFWDGGWSEPSATVLTDAAHAYGEYVLERMEDE